jgi:FkbM family methyltransferase
MVILNKISWQLKYKSLSIIYFIRGLFYPKFNLTDDIRIPINLSWSVFMLRYIYNRQIESSELEILKRTLNKGDRVMELGTGLGITSTYCAKIIGSLNVFTYDGNYFLEKHLKKMYKINEVNPTFSFHILTNSISPNEEIEFYVNKKNIISSSLSPVKHTHKITAKKLLFEEERKRIKPNYLIVDIEGAEYELVKGLSFEGIEKIQIELHPQLIGEKKRDEVLRNIEEKGFIRDIKVSKDIDQAFFYRKNE